MCKWVLIVFWIFIWIYVIEWWEQYTKISSAKIEQKHNPPKSKTIFHKNGKKHWGKNTSLEETLKKNASIRMDVSPSNLKHSTLQKIMQPFIYFASNTDLNAFIQSSVCTESYALLISRLTRMKGFLLLRASEIEV